MNKEEIIYTKDDFIIFKGSHTSWVMGNYVGKSLKEIEELDGRKIKEVYRYVSRKKTIFKELKEVDNMKVIDLLNKIANGEIPNRILYDHYIWSWTGDDYRTEIDGKEQFLITGMYYTWFTEFIKEEVEIIEEEPRDIEVCGTMITRSEYNKLAGIEEDNKIENITTFYDDTLEEYIAETKINGNRIKEHYGSPFEQMMLDKIKELIDEVNKLKEKE